MSTTLQQFRDEVLGIFADLTRLTTYQAELLAKLAAGGMTAEDEQAAFAEVQSVSQKMREAVAGIPTPPVEEPAEPGADEPTPTPGETLRDA